MFRSNFTFSSPALEQAAQKLCADLGLNGTLYSRCLFDVAASNDLRFALASASAAAAACQNTKGCNGNLKTLRTAHFFSCFKNRIS